ncbi:MAG: TlpA family protein disulfide reductase [Elusimicrobiaceae bacterium]|nr:TlpA family protein disulfide reductase [Elusimicrobiaceae bacterium]
MKKMLVLVGIVLLAAACFPKLPDIITLKSAQLPVVAEEDVLWQSEDYNGKPVLIVFMGSWCPWCKKTMPAVNALKAKYADRVEIVGAFMDQVPGPVRDAVQANGFTAKALYNAGELAEGVGVSGLPHTVLFNKKHQAVKVWEGYRPDMEEVVSVEIDKLVK